VVYQRQIRTPDNFIKCTEGFREQVAQFDFNFWRNPGEAGTNSSCGAVVPFTESGGEDQNSFHGAMRSLRRQCDGSLMDISGRQSKL
jgi:hypothetical protein